MRILLVEDDAALGQATQAALRLEGYTVDWLRDGQHADDALRSDTFDAVVLDLGLPRKDGLDVLSSLRARGDSTPVLCLTARDTLQDRVTGLDRGADDYLVKPFDLDELNARLRALMRRSAGRAVNWVECGALRMDVAGHQVQIGKESIDLSAREFAILHTLLESAGRVVARERLEDTLYGWDQEITSNALEVHIHHLRKKLGSEWIQTVRGAGYRLQAPEMSI
ncbi:MAG: response regulator [Gammaproteobacteria bacterium]